MDSKEKLRATQAGFDPIEYWDRLGPGWNLKLDKLDNGDRIYQYSHLDKRFLSRYREITVDNDGKLLSSRENY